MKTSRLWKIGPAFTLALALGGCSRPSDHLSFKTEPVSKGALSETVAATGEVSYGRVPAGSVVVSGTLPAADGSHSLYCAVIVKQVDAKTRAKTGINELLRA